MSVPDFSGSGYLAGEAPDGLTTVVAVPVSAAVQLLWRDPETDEEHLVASTTSAPDGTWRITGLNHELEYVVRGIKAGWNDVSVVGVTPTRMDQVTATGSFDNTNEFDGIAGLMLIEGGLPPYSVNVIDPLPFGLEPVLDGRTLTIAGTSDDSGQWNAVVRVQASNGPYVDVPVACDIHAPVVFSSAGSYVVPAGADRLRVLVVAGGGGGGSRQGGGGGAGGVRFFAAIEVSAGDSFAVAVGLGGAGGTSGGRGLSGQNSAFGDLVAIGGGGGGGRTTDNQGLAGGSGGGSAANRTYLGGSGTAGQGSAGGRCSPEGSPDANAGGGGGGASASGGDGNGVNSTGRGGDGGDGVYVAAFSVFGAGGHFGGGGGGGVSRDAVGAIGGAGGLGGGGAGAGPAAVDLPGSPGVDGSGGGGGGSNVATAAGGPGGRGVVIVKAYKSGT